MLTVLLMFSPTAPKVTRSYVVKCEAVSPFTQGVADSLLLHVLLVSVPFQLKLLLSVDTALPVTCSPENVACAPSEYRTMLCKSATPPRLVVNSCPLYDNVKT